ncbi:hypothetical protein [Comamonas thiooxydans]|uniref:hypothetical protein n=1 Tax=Comamonas thiooxydans TaxID=363952 RepID=UPI000B412177|nr:hypothetical protein [Comamonas thiooxydans]
MSTKVFTGLRFLTKDIGELGRLLRNVSPAIYALQQAQLNRFLVHSTLALLEGPDAQPGTASPGRAETISQVILARYYERVAKVKSSLRRDPAIDSEVLITCGISDGRILGLVRSELSNHVIQVLVTAAVAESYNYWNSDEPDPEVSASEWESRRQAWDRVLEPSAGMMFSYSLEDPCGLDFSPELSVFEQEVPPAAVRAQKYATHRILTRAATVSEVLALQRRLEVATSAEYAELQAGIRDIEPRLHTAEEVHAAWSRHG